MTRRGKDREWRLVSWRTGRGRGMTRSGRTGHDEKGGGGSKRDMIWRDMMMMEEGGSAATKTTERDEKLGWKEVGRCNGARPRVTAGGEALDSTRLEEAQPRRRRDPQGAVTYGIWERGGRRRTVP